MPISEEAGPDQPRASSRPVPTLSFVAFGASIASVAVVATAGVLTMQKKSDFDDGDRSHETADAFFRYRAITNVALGVAVVAAATGLVLWWTAAPRRTAASDVLRFAQAGVRF